jgi:hypothetical protein
VSETVNQKVAQQRLRWQISQQRLGIEQQRLNVMEMVERKQQHLTNIDAHNRAIVQLEADLAALEQASGPLTEEDITTYLRIEE